jgi:hypothetical protein
LLVLGCFILFICNAHVSLISWIISSMQRPYIHPYAYSISSYCLLLLLLPIFKYSLAPLVSNQKIWVLLSSKTVAIPYTCGSSSSLSAPPPLLVELKASSWWTLVCSSPLFGAWCQRGRSSSIRLMGLLLGFASLQIVKPRSSFDLFGLKFAFISVWWVLF